MEFQQKLQLELVRPDDREEFACRHQPSSVLQLHRYGSQPLWIQLELYRRVD
jgi:hypothetical protein